MLHLSSRGARLPSRRPSLRHVSRRRRSQCFRGAEPLEPRLLLSTLTVTTLDDVVNDGDGVLSLREAILIANDNTGATSFDGVSSGDVADEIQFDPGLLPGTITLNGTQLTITSDLTIIGPGAALLTIDGNNASRVFRVDDGNDDSVIAVTLEGVTITGGNAVGNILVGNGAGVFNNREDLTIRDSVIAANTAGGHGGGVASSFGTLTIENSTINGNTASTGSGGGVFTQFTTTVTIHNSDISGNTSTVGNGGGVRAQSGTLTITDSIVSNNTVDAGHSGGGISGQSNTIVIERTTLSGNAGGHGGGIRQDTDGTLTICDSTISGNTSLSGSGGGVSKSAGTSLDIRGSTISGNTAGEGGGGLFANFNVPVVVLNSTVSGNSANLGGGGLFIDGTTTTLLVGNSTVTNNRADADGNATGFGGGILGQSGAGAVTLESTIVAGNVRGAEGMDTPSDLEGATVNGSFSLIGDAATAGGLMDGMDANIVGADPMLGPLADNGGPTLTHRLGPGSPAINSGANPSDLTSDQRGAGFPRVAGSAADIGALESVIVVNSAGDDETAADGLVTLREAIIAANTNTATDLGDSGNGADVIVFQIPGAGVRTISLTSALPDITETLTIDGYTQPGAAQNTNPAGFNGVLLIELDGSGAGADVNGLVLSAHMGSTIRGLIINRFTGNVVSGFVANGIFVTGGSGHTFEGNLIGTDATGMMDLGNAGRGVSIINSDGNLIGGTSPADRNVISGNNSNGILLANGADNNVVQGNLIGVNAAGTASLPNVTSNVFILNNSKDNLIGGTAAGAGNLISGTVTGISIGNTTTTGTIVQGNLIGTDVTGTVDLGNSEGISINSAPQTLIGGTDPAARNIISGHSSAGISISNLGADDTVVQGNFIGTDITGTLAIPNSVGIWLSHGFSGAPADTLIGGTMAGTGNLITFNSADGVRITGGFSGGMMMDTFPIGTQILGNSIHSNVGLGIDLSDDGVTLNDAGDADAGANNLQNFPVITAAETSGVSTTVHFMLNSAANTSFRIEFFSNAAADPSGHGEGQMFLGATELMTDGDGDLAGSLVLPAVAVGQFITSTATNLMSNDTSEFSAAAEVADCFIVTNTNDSGPGSLRNAIVCANETPGLDVISFDPAVFSTPQMITLTSGQITLTDSASILGPGANLLTISGNNTSRIFNVNDSDDENQIAVELIGLTLTGGDAMANTGGAIFTRENLTITRSALVDNTAGSSGGAIFNNVGGNLIVIDSTISGNTAGGFAGGIATTGGTLTVTNSTISGNSSTLDGGGIFNNLGPATIVNSTITGNSTEGDGGGIRNTASGTLTLTSTIIAGNVVGMSATPSDLSGNAQAGSSFNLIGDAGSAGGMMNGTNNNIVGTDPLLGPLADNGGPMLTHALLPGSPAIDAGSNPQDMDFDQRGEPFARVFNAMPDIGAFEAQLLSLVVDNIGDADDGDYSAGNLTLREAVNLANLNPAADTITFAAAIHSSTITLMLGELPITGPVTINGPGAELLTISGNNTSRIFNIDDGDGGTQIDVEILGLLLTGGDAGAELGGGILNHENLMITHSIVADSASPNGGGIFNHGTLLLTDSAVENNVAGFNGGGIFNNGTLTVTGSAIRNNTAASSSGGIRNNNGTVTITHSTLSGNSTSGSGGGLNNTGTATVINSTISGNLADTDGGGIYKTSLGTLTISNSTITANRADADGNAFGSGGGVLSDGGTLTLSSTIVAGNFAGMGNDPADLSGADVDTVDSAFNLIGDAGSAGGLMNGANNNIVGADPLLGPLADNGGPTLTHALLPGSPAIDAGANPLALDFDQRGEGFPRVANGTADIGSFESLPPPTAITIDDVAMLEGDAGTTAFIFTVSLDEASTVDVMVDFATANGTATAGVDYTAAAGTLTIPAGETSGQIIVLVNGDTTVEFNETFFINLSNPVNGTLADSQGLGTILNDDQPRITINNISMVEGDGGQTSFVFTVTLDRPSVVDVMVDAATANGTAIAGEDYIAASGTLTIPAGETSGELGVQVNGDTTVEFDETFFVNLSNPVNAVIEDSQGVATILNDDQPLVSIADVMMAEGNSGFTNFFFMVTLDRPSVVDVMVTFATADGTAVVGDDYTAADGVLTIPAGFTFAQIAVQVHGDRVIEPDETFFLNLSSPVNAAIDTGQGMGTILNDDGVDLAVELLKVKLFQNVIPGDKGFVKIKVTNIGNVLAQGLATLQLLASPDDALGDDELVRELLGRKINIKPGKSKMFKIKFMVPLDAPASQFHLIARLLPDEAIGDVVEANNHAVTGEPRELVHRFGTFGDRKNVKLTLIGPGEVPTRFQLSGMGFGEVTGDGDDEPFDSFFDVLLTGTDGNGVFQVKTPKGMNTVLRHVAAPGGLKTIKAPVAHLHGGDWELPGLMKLLRLGDVQDSMIDVLQGVNVVRLGEVAGSQLNIPAINALKAQGFVNSHLAADTVKNIVLKRPAGAADPITFVDSFFDIFVELGRANLGRVQTISPMNMPFGLTLGGLAEKVILDTEGGQTVAARLGDLPIDDLDDFFIVLAAP